MSGGGQQQTATTSNQPPQAFMDAYKAVLSRAQNVANTPYTPYPGNLQAGFSPLQQQGFGVIGNAGNLQAPFINTAGSYLDAAAAPLSQDYRQFLDKGMGYANSAADASLQGAIQPWQATAAQGFGSAGSPVNLMGFGADQVAKYMSPYTQNVVDATQAQFNQQNAQQDNRLRGNAASQGALGGDRLGVARAALAGQQQTAQAPVIAGLYNQGYGQALSEFNTQQAADLQAQQLSKGFGLQAAQGFAGLGNQSLTAEQQQAANRLQAAGIYSGYGQQIQGNDQAQRWLDMQAASGFGGLGNQLLQGQLGVGQAMLGAGGQQQQQAQTSLNIPYQQWLAQQAYPFQTTQWLSNIAQGVGGSAGGTTTQTQPAPSGFSQAAGLGLGAAGVIGATGGFGSGGWLTGSNGIFGSGGGAANAMQAAGNINMSTSPFFGPGYGFRGGLVDGLPHRAAGGGVPDVSGGYLDLGDMPGDVHLAGFGVPDQTAGYIPQGGGGGGTPYQKRDWGKTQTTSTSSGGGFGDILRLGGTVAGIATGNPWIGLATNVGTGALGLADGGSTDKAPISIAVAPGRGGFGLPQVVQNPTYDSSQLDAYLANTKASALPPPMPAPAAPAPAAAGPAVPPGAWEGPDLPGVKTGQPVSDFERGIIEKFGGLGFPQGESYGGGGEAGGFARGGRMLRGFAAGGMPDSDLFPSYDDPDSATGMRAQMLAGVDLPNFDAAIPPRQAIEAPDYTSPAPDESDLPTPPIPPAAQRRPGGFGAARPAAAPADLPVPPVPANDTSAPANDDRAMPQQQAVGFGTPLPREVPRGANPWMALAMAGFGAAAGRSPNALQNLAGGAAAGLQSYQTADQAARALSARADETRARLAEASAYHRATIDQRDRSVDQRREAAKDRADMAYQTAMLRIANRGASHTSEGDVLSQAISELQQQENPETGKPFTRAEAYRYTKGIAGREAAQQDRLRQGDERIDISRGNADFQRQQAQIRQQLRERGMDDANIGRRLAAATKLVTGDLTGKTTLAGAMDQVEAIAGGGGGGAPEPRPTNGAKAGLPPAQVDEGSARAAALDGARKAIAAGKDPGAVRQRLLEHGIDPRGL